jgi:hypothetical protein
LFPTLNTGTPGAAGARAAPAPADASTAPAMTAATGASPRFDPNPGCSQAVCIDRHKA